MRNGIKDAFEMLGIVSKLNKIIKLRKKYDFKGESIPVSEKYSIEYRKILKTCYILLNNNRLIQYNYGNIRGGAGAFKAGATLGILKSNIFFVTKDKTVANHKTVKDISNTLTDKMSEIEKYLQNASNNKWGV